eukprot:TRINITY_DN30473_c0_g1_i1.p1 TRINITY_DN30473_c0_g1~~TRINITY_DN30473_c0_g1_i1.p1  ORF type:complete len:122 (+),score=67.77 TRINITY_DN30473_c0_g1_i1:47-412(+)
MLFFLMIRRPPRSTQSRSSAASDVYKRQDKRPWEVPCEIAMPCATQNELNLDEAKMLIKNGVVAVSEGANMPTSNEGVDAFLDAGVVFGPATVSYTHLRAHETVLDLVCRLLLEKKKHTNS